MSNYGAGILTAGKAGARRISEGICNERATKPAVKRTSQNCSSYSFALPYRASTALDERTLSVCGKSERMASLSNSKSRFSRDVRALGPS